MLKLNDNIKSVKNVFVGSANESVTSPKEYRVYFIANITYDNGFSIAEEIGFYDFKNKYGTFKNIFVAEKEYKNYKSMLNYVYNNIDSMACIDTKIESKTVNTAKEIIKAENITLELKEAENNNIEVVEPTITINETNTTNSTITESTTDQPQTSETETVKPTITDDSIKVNQAITEGYTTLKEADNVQIIGKIESHTSYISNETYDIVTDLKIIKDSSIIYEAYRIDFPINYEGKISLVNYLDDIILYINNSTIEPYWMNIQLDKLFKNMSTTNFEINIKQLKNKIAEENRIKEKQQKEKEIQELKTSVIALANNKNMLVAIGSENIRLLKDLQQSQTSKDFIEAILNMNINDKMIKPHLVKSFEAGDTIGMTYDEINKRLLLETKEYLQAM